MSLQSLLSRLFGSRERSRLDVVLRENEVAARAARRSMLKEIRDDSEAAGDLRAVRQQQHMAALLDETLEVIGKRKPR